MPPADVRAAVVQNTGFPSLFRPQTCVSCYLFRTPILKYKPLIVLSIADMAMVVSSIPQ